MQEEMHITHICLGGPVTDGWNYQENVLTKYQRLNGNEVTIITSRWIWDTDGKLILEREKVDYINSDRVHIIRLKMKGKENFNNKFKRYERVYQAIESTKPDILFIHSVSYLDILTVVKFLKSHSNVIAYADNHADLSNSGTNILSKYLLQKGIWRYCAQKLNPYVKKFYGVLPSRVDFLNSIYGIPKEKCELLIMGADDELVKAASDPEIRQKIRKKYNIKANDFLIITGGKIDQWKTQTLLLMKAIKRFKYNNVKLIVFGSVIPELANQINALSDGKKIQYVGWIQAKDSYEYFAAADLVVFPGRHSVFWEQVVAQGIPIVVKDWPGTHHIDLGGNVKFITKDSVDEIQSILKEIIEHPLIYDQMKKAAETETRKQFYYLNIALRSIEI